MAPADRLTQKKYAPLLLFRCRRVLRFAGDVWVYEKCLHIVIDIGVFVATDSTTERQRDSRETRYMIE